MKKHKKTKLTKLKKALDEAKYYKSLYHKIIGQTYNAANIVAWAMKNQENMTDDQLDTLLLVHGNLSVIINMEEVHFEFTRDN